MRWRTWLSQWACCCGVRCRRLPAASVSSWSFTRFPEAAGLTPIGYCSEGNAGAHWQFRDLAIAGEVQTVTNQVTTPSDGASQSQPQPDTATGLTSRYRIQDDVAGRNWPAWHARGLGFESPQL